VQTSGLVALVFAHSKQRTLPDRRSGTTRATVLAVVIVGLIGPVGVDAQGITIDHNPAGCLVAGRFPQLEARLDPAEQVSRARIEFHAEGDTRWYYVDMKPETGVFRAILPRPLRVAKAIHYYIEATDKNMAQSRTAEYSPIVADPGECSKKGLLIATPLAKATVQVGSSAGAGVPTGFAASGIVAATAAAGAVGAAGAAGGGGVGATALVLGGVAVAAGATAVVVATHKSPSANLETYTINVSVAGSFHGQPGGATTVCVSYEVALNGATQPDPCLTIPIGQTGQILALARPGTNYTVSVPPGQSGPSCSVTSGGAGVFGQSMATVAVNCT
jgi:hypothetical protein